MTAAPFAIPLRLCLEASTSMTSREGEFKGLRYGLELPPVMAIASTF